MSKHSQEDRDRQGEDGYGPPPNEKDQKVLDQFFTDWPQKDPDRSDNQK